MRNALAYAIVGALLLAGTAVEAWLERKNMNRLSVLFLAASRRDDRAALAAG
jgi:hypothetical protein